MRVLICTQKVDKDDAVLGFFHRYLVEFAKYFDEVTVIALGVGEYDLPKNVHVFSLGKENGAGTVSYIRRFVPLIIRERKNYDAVFVHMSVEFAILGGLLWKLMGKRVVMWYTHRQGSVRLRIGSFFADSILTAAEESFPYKTPKLRIIGHGIETARFQCPPDSESHAVLSILTVGRITRIKNCDTLLQAVATLRDQGLTVHATFLGAPVTSDDKKYEEELLALIKKLDIANLVSFPGSIPNSQIGEWYCKSDIVANMTPTGGLDKTVIEAMAGEKAVIVSNTAYAVHFGNYQKELLFKERDSADLALKIKALVDPEIRRPIASYLQGYARAHFDVTAIVAKISGALKNE